MEIKSQFIQLDKLKLHYLEAGKGDPVLLLHGWPTSSYLWRNIIPEMAKTNRVIALDLPGFGQSDKPLGASYSFPFFSGVIDDFLAALRIKKLGLAVHDLGGPVGLYWACKNRERVTRLALLNTLIYPEMSWAVVLFVAVCRLPVAGGLISSPRGIRFSMRYGVDNKGNLDGEPLAAYQAPFADKASRKALLKAAYGLHPKGFKKIATALPYFDCPVRVVYGENDRILPDVEKTMTRVKRDLPQAEVTSLPGCGHFLQEDKPEEVARLLADFF
ncbi:MAG: alpha/beta fold hydrolase [Nevskiales bacterium]